VTVPDLRVVSGLLQHLLQGRVVGRLGQGVVVFLPGALDLRQRHKALRLVQVEFMVDFLGFGVGVFGE